MSPYIETIRLQDGALRNIRYHQERFERTRVLELRLMRHPELAQEIRIPDGMEHGLFKCRVVYGKRIERIEYEPYQRLRVGSLKVVQSETIAYGFKYADRSALEVLFRLKGPCDDILIVKSGFITDSYFANAVFWDGRDWFTPDSPLLAGTMRASLLDQGLLKVARIAPENLANYEKVRLINAMNDLSEGPEIEINKVIF